MNRASWLPALAAPILCVAVTAADDPGLLPDLNAIHKGSPEYDIALLDTSSPPRPVREFFVAARQAFEAHPKATLAEVPEIGRSASDHGIVLLGGPMLGALTPEGARIWVRTARPAEVSVIVQLPGEERKFGPVASTAESDFVAVVPVSGLQPATRYPYRVSVDGRDVPVPEGCALTTAPAPGVSGRVRMAFGADFHKSGLWRRSLLERVRERGATAMFLLGDLAADDRRDRTGLYRCDALLRDLSPGWRSLAAGVGVYATWDDHDYFANDASGIPPGRTGADRSAVRTAWMQCWNNPASGFEDRGQGIFFHTRLGPCDLIMLDTRFFRTTPGEPDSILGREQMRWLEGELAACTAPFIVLTGGTMWSDDISAGKDSWGVWDRSGRDRIFNFIEERRIGGVLLLSGDRHGARVMKIQRPSGFVFHEFEMGSLGAHQGPAAFGKDPGHQPFGLIGEALFGEFEFDTTVPDPTVAMRAVDSEGHVRYEINLARSQLIPRPPSGDDAKPGAERTREHR